MLPNKIPIACPFNIHFGSVQTNFLIEDQINILQETIIGHVECIDSLHINQNELIIFHQHVTL